MLRLKMLTLPFIHQHLFKMQIRVFTICIFELHSLFLPSLQFMSNKPINLHIMLGRFCYQFVPQPNMSPMSDSKLSPMQCRYSPLQKMSTLLYPQLGSNAMCALWGSNVLELWRWRVLKMCYRVWVDGIDLFSV